MAEPKIHSTAEVHPTAQIGDGGVVWGGAYVGPNTVLGEFCSVGRCAEIGSSVVIGDRSRIGFGVFVPNLTRIGSCVFIGPGVIMTDDRYPRVNNPFYRGQPSVIEDYTVIGAGAVILPGVRICRGALVGAGSVVIHDVPAWTTVLGNPARFAHVRQESISEI